MKKLMKIGALILFMIGLFTVQLDLKPLLVDNDVGIETVSIDKFINSPADVVMFNLEIPAQVSLPLKYPSVNSEIYTIKSEKEICSNQFVLINSYAALPDDTMSGQIKEQNIKAKQTGKILANMIEGPFRLDIGENFNQNYIS